VMEEGGWEGVVAGAGGDGVVGVRKGEVSGLEPGRDFLAAS